MHHPEFVTFSMAKIVLIALKRFNKQGPGSRQSIEPRCFMNMEVSSNRFQTPSFQWEPSIAQMVRFYDKDKARFQKPLGFRMVNKNIHTLKKGKSSRNETTSYNYHTTSGSYGVVRKPRSRCLPLKPTCHLRWYPTYSQFDVICLHPLFWITSLFGKWC